MPIFPQHLATDVQDLFTAKYSKIETQLSGSNDNVDINKTFTFSLVNLNNPFQLQQVIRVLRPILTHSVNFAVGYIF